MHVLPRVRELEERFPDTLSVIGVHAGKFSTERHTDRIADACERLSVRHAVVNDRQFRVWRSYAVTAWPTIALIDPAGYLLGTQSGEFPVDPIADVIEHAIHTAELAGILRRGPDPAASPPRAPRSGPLRFPTRAIVSDTALWVSDTGNGRVLECDLAEKEMRATVRRVHEGFVEPRGLAVLGGHAYVADRRGQAVWALGAAGARERVAGTGRLGDSRIEGRDPSVDLRSPWGLAATGDGLAVAMAGSHQLWGLDPAARDLRLLAGRGGEELVDGPAASALLAQPTGVAATGQGIVFADCESSAVRTLERDTVSTHAGTGLFDFGDRDGGSEDALLQHAEDVAAHPAGFVVADTYNDRLRLVDPVRRRVSGWPGDAGMTGELREPAGVSVWGDRLLVADTGHHRVVAVSSAGEVSEIAFS